MHYLRIYCLPSHPFLEYNSYSRLLRRAQCRVPREQCSERLSYFWHGCRTLTTGHRILQGCCDKVVKGKRLPFFFSVLSKSTPPLDGQKTIPLSVLYHYFDAHSLTSLYGNCSECMLDVSIYIVNHINSSRICLLFCDYR